MAAHARLQHGTMREPRYGFKCQIASTRKLLKKPDRFASVYTEDLFQAFPVDQFPHLRPWYAFMAERYAYATARREPSGPLGSAAS